MLDAGRFIVLVIGLVVLRPPFMKDDDPPPPVQFVMNLALRGNTNALMSVVARGTLMHS